MDPSDIRSLEFLDLTGVDASERDKIRSSLQQHNCSVQLPWVKPSKKTLNNSLPPAEPQQKTEAQDHIPELQPVTVSPTYEYYPHAVISPTLYHQQPSMMVQPIMTYQHHSPNVIYYNAVSPMSPPYPLFVQQGPAVHGYPHNNAYEYQQTVQIEEIVDEVVHEPQHNGQAVTEEEIVQYEADPCPLSEPVQAPQVIPNGVEVTSPTPTPTANPTPTPTNKSWASLFNPAKTNNVNVVSHNSEKSTSDQAINNESNNNNIPVCPIKHPRRYQQFVDPDCYRIGEFLVSYSIDGRAVSLQPRGLLNQSNYCYINSILQALIACPPLYNLLCNLSGIISSNEKRKPTPVIDGMCRFVREFHHLPSNVRTKDRRVDKNAKKDQGVIVNTGIPFEPTWIYKMLNSMRTDLIEGRQEDAEEFLGFLLNGLNDEMLEMRKLVENLEKDQPTTNSLVDNDTNDEWQVMGSKNKGSVTRRTDFDRTPISDIFGGLLKSRIHRAGDHITENIQPFLTLQLNIEKVKTVREALEALITKNPLEGLTSSKTNEEVEAWQQVMLDDLPVILILHLKCFDFQQDGCTKIVKALEFGVDLKIDSKLISSKTQTPKEKQYKLFAVVYHDGKEASKGHYVTDAFHVGYSCWLRYDDASVKTVLEEHVLKPQGTRVPYLLFYRRCDTIRGK